MKKRTLVKLSLCARKKMRMFPILTSGSHTENDTAARYKMCTAPFTETSVEEKLVIAKQVCSSHSAHSGYRSKVRKKSMWRIFLFAFPSKAVQHDRKCMCNSFVLFCQAGKSPKYRFNKALSQKPSGSEELVI